MNKKLLSAFIGALMVVAFVVTPAGAQTSNDTTIAQLMAQIQALQAQLIALGGSQSGTGYVFTTNMGIGASGESVRQLQVVLNMDAATMVAITGAGSRGMETTYFGPLTQAAVMKFQAKYAAEILAPLGLSSPTGYVGAATRAKLNSMSGVVTPAPVPGTPTPIPGILQGGAGSISDADFISSLTNEDVGEDSNDVAVAGLRIEADDGSDIMLTAARLVFDESTGATADFYNYADDVSIWFNGALVARVDGSNFNDDNAWSQTVSITGSAIIRAGATGELVVKVSGVNNLDSSDAGDSWTVEFNSIRFKDAQGATVTETSTGDIGGATRTFSFETFATAASSELRLQANNSAINDARVIQVHATDEGVSDNVQLLAFSMEAKGTSDLKIKDFGVDVVVTGAADVDDIIIGGTSPAIRFEINGQAYGTAAYNETAANNREIAFTDIDYTIPAGTKVNVIIEADLGAVDTDLDVGDTILAQVTETQTDDTALVDVRDESSTQILDVDMAGEPASGAHAVYESGINVTLVSSSASVSESDTDNADVATFTMVFDVTAFATSSVYIGDTSAATTAADGAIGTIVTDAFQYRVYGGGTATTEGLTALITFTTPTGVTDSTDNIKIDDGYTSRVTMTVTKSVLPASGGIDGIYYMDLAAIGWGIADDTTYEYNYVYNIDNFRTSTVQLN